MKIAFITHYTELYGANRSLLGLIGGLKQYGVEAHVLVPKEGDITAELKKINIPYAVFSYESWMTEKKIFPGRLHYRLMQRYEIYKEAKARMKRNRSLLPQIIAQLNSWKIDLVYSNSSVISIGYLAAKQTNKKHVWHFREMGMLDYKLSPDVNPRTYRRITNTADAIIAVSRYLADTILMHVDPAKKHVIYNGIISKNGLEELSRMIPEPKKDNAFTFALLGVIQEGKGQDTAIRAMALVVQRHRNAQLLIAGNGKTEKLEALIDQLELSDHVHFIGYVENPYTLMNSSDVVLMCSKHEAMGRVTVEAMAAGKPVIGYNGGGTTELIAQEKNGLLYSGGEKELAESMVRLIENPLWARELGANGRQTVAEKFTVEAYAKNVYDVLQKVLGSRV